MEPIPVSLARDHSVQVAGVWPVVPFEGVHSSAVSERNCVVRLVPMNFVLTEGRQSF